MNTASRSWLIVLAVVLLVAFLGPGLGWGMMGPGMMGAWGAAADPWWGIAMLLFWVLIIAGAATLAVWALRQVGPGAETRRRPLDILKERYARGEITPEQYEQMRRDLEQPG